MCDNNVFFYNFLTKILAWSAILYHIGSNIEYAISFLASLSKKCDVLLDVLGFRWPGPTMPKMVRIFNIAAYVI